MEINIQGHWIGVTEEEHRAFSKNTITCLDIDCMEESSVQCNKCFMKRHLADVTELKEKGLIRGE